MNSTALGAENIIFISEAHERFFHEKLKEVRYQDTYHKALIYCLGICEDTRRNVNNIYDFKSGCVIHHICHLGHNHKWYIMTLSKMIHKFEGD